MSWLSNLFGGGGEDPEAVRQRAAGQAAEANQQALQMQMDFLNQAAAGSAGTRRCNCCCDRCERPDSAASRCDSSQSIDL